MTHGDYKKAKIYHYCSENPKKKANAAFLMGAYQIIAMKKTAKDAWKPFVKETFLDFRDAMKGVCSYKCTVSSIDSSFEIDFGLLGRTRICYSLRLV